jgi:hypothetical protein
MKLVRFGQTGQKGPGLLGSQSSLLTFFLLDLAIPSMMGECPRPHKTGQKILPRARTPHQSSVPTKIAGISFVDDPICNGNAIEAGIVISDKSVLLVNALTHGGHVCRTARRYSTFYYKKK